MSNPRMTVAELREALKGIPGDTFATVWLPGSRIDLAGFTALTKERDEALIEGNLRAGSALSADADDQLPLFNDSPVKPGPTGEFPRGKLNADDEGALRIGITNKDNTVIVSFGKQVAWVGMPKDNAIQFAELILQHARELK